MLGWLSYCVVNILFLSDHVHDSSYGTVGQYISASGVDDYDLMVTGGEVWEGEGGGGGKLFWSSHGALLALTLLPVSLKGQCNLFCGAWGKRKG